MAAPKKITVYSIHGGDEKDLTQRTKDWVFTLNGDKVDAEMVHPDAVYPTVYDKEADGGKGRALSPKDGARFMEILKTVRPSGTFTEIEVED